MNALQFAVKFSNLTPEQKVETINKLQARTKGKLELKHEIILDGILSWCKVNQFLGDELCPPNTVTSFL